MGKAWCPVFTCETGKKPSESAAHSTETNRDEETEAD